MIRLSGLPARKSPVTNDPSSGSTSHEWPDLLSPTSSVMSNSTARLITSHSRTSPSESCCQTRVPSGVMRERMTATKLAVGTVTASVGKVSVACIATSASGCGMRLP